MSTRNHFTPHRLLTAAALLLGGLCISPTAFASDIYDAAVAHAGRSSDDQSRDVTDRPDKVLRFAGIRPGMTVADFFAARRLLQRVAELRGRTEGARAAAQQSGLRQVRQQRVEATHRETPSHQRRASHGRPGAHGTRGRLARRGDHGQDLPRPLLGRAAGRLAEDRRVIRARPARARAQARRPAAGRRPFRETGQRQLRRRHAASHRRAVHAQDFEAHGFTFANKSDVLRRSDDRLDQVSYKEPMLGKTDRFVYTFHKSG